ncbi:hypothetical protein MASR1M107_25130 [Ignavibacteriales bacterium]
MLQQLEPITLTPAGDRSVTGGINLLQGSTVGAAQFTVSGLEGSLFSLELPTTTYITNETFGADVMEVTQYSVDLTEPYTIGIGVPDHIQCRCHTHKRRR